MLTDPKVGEFQVIGYCKVPYPPKSIAWHKSLKSTIKPKYENLLVNLSFGVLLINSPQPNPVPLTSTPPTELKGIDMYGCRTDPKQSIIFSTSNGDLFTSGEDLYFKKYKLPEDQITKFNPEAKVAIPAPVD